MKDDKTLDKLKKLSFCDLKVLEKHCNQSNGFESDYWNELNELIQEAFYQKIVEIYSPLPPKGDAPF